MERTEEQGVEVDKASSVFVGRWIRLVSTTNWEKGRIVYEWRQSLIDAGAPTSEYSDEAWSKRVGGVSGQHTGRLRRVYQRFGKDYEQYKGLFWSHFQAAVDWEDAEMWLEGAVHKGWSVSQMRQQRWEALGLPEDLKPFEEEIVAEETDQDLSDADSEDADTSVASSKATRQTQEFSGDGDSFRPEGPDFGDEDDYAADDGDEEYSDDDEDGGERASRSKRSSDDDDSSNDTFLADPEKAVGRESIRPFSGLAKLPPDLSDALESFKLAILRHKTDQWREVPADDVLAALEGLKQLVLAPSA